MPAAIVVPIGISLSADIEYREGRTKPYKARVRWVDPVTKKRPSKSESFAEEREAQQWIEQLEADAENGIDPRMATMPLAEYGEANMPLIMRGLETKSLDPYMAGWRLRVVPTVGHLPVRRISNGVVDRAVHAWIADGYSRSVVKNSIAPLVRAMEQARRDGLVEYNPARVTGWQKEYKLAEDELEDPRALALPDWYTLTALADALVARSYREYRGWGDVVVFEACTATRIGEVSGCRVKDIDTKNWIWNLRRQTTPGPGGLLDKGTKGKRARKVPIIEDIRDLVLQRIALTDGNPDARLFVGPRGGRVTTAILRDATHWDEIVTQLGYEHLRRHDLRHTGLTWMADAGVPVHHLQKIAGHGSIITTQRYLHPDQQTVTDAGELLTEHLRAPRTPRLLVVK
ncbi:tyrosine-type recombinase/integrase [Amycolatopsis azurea]|uniref:Integrase n=1 Tax=Amycolatopsis azurea DSM 43854 TaxID=1238180 RepID=M2PV66_9PSEU|nr:site-specific integrase [Amycolatopsis azurea]EMD23435.1 phage integrase [Amycolatopsis azurea DSM 43854]OOC04886.1 integrase [Amycolatopsis azurea DSM 43854]